MIVTRGLLYGGGTVWVWLLVACGPRRRDTHPVDELDGHVEVLQRELVLVEERVHLRACQRVISVLLVQVYRARERRNGLLEVAQRPERDAVVAMVLRLVGADLRAVQEVVQRELVPPLRVVDGVN
eukprot:9476570-Pyramimonas_sp.AAC.3